MCPQRGVRSHRLGTDGRHGLGLHSHAVQRSSWFSIGPEQEDTLQVAAGTSSLGDLQRWQPKVRPFQDRDSGSEDDVANGKPGMKSERWAQQSPAVSWKQGSRESLLITGSWAPPPPSARPVASSPPSRPPRGRPGL